MSATSTANPFRQTTPKPGEGGQYELPPADTHTACLVGIIDLGTQRSDYGGKTTWSRKVFLVWELVGVEMVSVKGKNHLVGEQYTNSLNEKARLHTEVIRPWRGSDLREGEEFDLGSMLGKKCLLGISHETTKTTNKQFAKIISITKLPPKTKIDEPQNKPVLWFIGCGEDVPDWLPKLFGRDVEDVVNDSREMTGGAEKPIAGNGSPASAGGEEEVPF